MTEMLGNVFYSVFTFFPTLVIYMYACSSHFQLRITRITALKYVVTAGTIMVLAYNLSTILVDSKALFIAKYILFSLFIYIFTVKFFKLETKKAIVPIIVIIICNAMGNIFGLVVLSCINISMKNFEQEYLYLMLLAVLRYIFIFGVLAMWIYYNKFQMLPIKVKKVEIRAFHINLAIIMLICVANTSLCLQQSENRINTYVFILNLILVTAFLFVAIFNLNTHLRIAKTKEELDVQNFYNNTMQAFIDEINNIKHTYTNTLNVMYGYASIEEWDGLHTYFQNIVKNCRAVNSMQEMINLKIENAGILGLFSSKLEYASKNDITVNIFCEKTIEQIDARMFILCDILGCFIDNAIEASAQSDEKFLKLSIFDEEDRQRFIIENSYKIKPELDKIFIKGFSTKGTNRGAGLWYCRNVIDKEKNLSLKTYFNNFNFAQELIITKSRVTK